MGRGNFRCREFLTERVTRAFGDDGMGKGTPAPEAGVPFPDGARREPPRQYCTRLPSDLLRQGVGPFLGAPDREGGGTHGPPHLAPLPGAQQ